LRSRRLALFPEEPNRNIGTFWRSKPNYTGMEAMGSQFLANLGRTGLNIIRHAGALLCSTQRNPTTEELRDKAFGSYFVGLD
jgi:hypothetical protein